MHWAVILAGGSGTRFWPLSTPGRPKQVLPLLEAGSTAQEAVARLEGLVPRERILVVTGAALAAPLQAHLGLDGANLLVEPRAASTGPALLWATHEIGRRDPEALVLSLHADWHVRDAIEFRRVAERALAAAGQHRRLVTVGMVPSRPETGFGYIVPGEALDAHADAVARFVEKPTRERAAELITRRALWNSGLFAWRADTLLAEVAAHTPEMQRAIGHLDAGDVAGFFRDVQEVSIDVGVLERSARVAVVRGSFGWDDVGTWEALGRVRPCDAHGNVSVGPVFADEASDSIVYSDGLPVVVSHVKGLVVVVANGRVLVMPRTHAAALKSTLDAMPAAMRTLP